MDYASKAISARMQRSGRASDSELKSPAVGTYACTVLRGPFMLTPMPSVALLDSRMGHRLAHLVEKHGGLPLCLPLERLLGSILEGRTDALAVTCETQFRELYDVASSLGCAPELVRALNDRVIVATIGPSCHAMLQSRGVDVRVIPDTPKMAPLVTALMRYLELHCAQRFPMLYPQTR